VNRIVLDGLPNGFMAMADAKTDPSPDGRTAISARLVITDPAGGQHAVVLQFFVDGPAQPEVHEPG
jgi:hypothetical protein